MRTITSDKYYPREQGALGKVDTLISCHVSGVNVINAVKQMPFQFYLIVIHTFVNSS